MEKLGRILKRLFLGLLGTVALLTLLTVIFVNMSPQFGEDPTSEQQRRYAAGANFKDGKFQNQIPTKVDLSFGQMIKVMGNFFFAKIPGKTPRDPLPMLKVDSVKLADRSPDVMRLTWLGHSAIMLEAEGKKILIDPMLGQHAGPLSVLSPARFSTTLPIDIDAMPFIDVVVISHDHYDHLDYGSIRKLKDKTGRFYVPLGVGAHLKSWGVDPKAITELDWWQEVKFDEFVFVCAPARHFSGRGLNGNKSLWSSWVIRTPSQQYYFSGDSGYGPHFAEIGKRFGPMDFVMMECGQYNDLWSAIHMMPEQTVQATRDVGGKVLMPIHWGAFALAMHTWNDPVVRVTAEANRTGVPVVTPKIGEMLNLNSLNVSPVRWWEQR